MRDELQELIESSSKHDGQNSAALANLESDIQQERDKRREERFLFVAVIVCLIDGFLFQDMETLSGPLVIGLLELCALLVFARHCGIEEVQQLIDKFLAVVRVPSEK